MNKQELIEKLTEYVNRYEAVTDEYYQGRHGAYGVALKLVKQLDEPRKPVVPKFVAEWISFCKNKNKKLGYAIHDCFLRDFLLERFGDDDDRVRWLTDYKNQEILARAWLDGYEVEKEPLYYVKHKNDDTYFVEFINSSFSSVWDDEINRIKSFKDKTKADAVAVLVSGEVVEG